MNPGSAVDHADSAFMCRDRSVMEASALHTQLSGPAAAILLSAQAVPKRSSDPDEGGDSYSSYRDLGSSARPKRKARNPKAGDPGHRSPESSSSQGHQGTDTQGSERRTDLRPSS